MQRTLPIGSIGPTDDTGDGATEPERRDQLSFLVHDMQSVVTSVSLMVELLELTARAGDDSIQRARAVSARNSCRQMAALCTEAARLLDYTIDEDPVPQEFDLPALLVEVMTVYSPIYDLAGKTLKLVTKSNSPLFFGDRSQLFRAVSNLLDNGLKHTSNESAVVVTSTTNRTEFIVSISDDGPGMENIVIGKSQPIDSLPVVIERLPDVAPALAPGTGLKFVSEAVALHGGSSTVELNSRAGTTVTLRFAKHKLE